MLFHEPETGFREEYPPVCNRGKSCVHTPTVCDIPRPPELDSFLSTGVHQVTRLQCGGSDGSERQLSKKARADRRCPIVPRSSARFAYE
jgi:hypothetical protein